MLKDKYRGSDERHAEKDFRLDSVRYNEELLFDLSASYTNNQSRFAEISYIIAVVGRRLRLYWLNNSPYSVSYPIGNYVILSSYIDEYVLLNGAIAELNRNA